MSAQTSSNVSRALVFDNGSGLFKAGFIGEEKPNVVFPSVITRSSHSEEVLVGDAGVSVTEQAQLSSPIVHGVITNWDELEKIWQYSFSRLGVASDSQPVLLTDAALNPKPNRQKMTEMMFEKFNAPALYVGLQPVLALYGAGRTTGLVLDIGDGVTSAVPIYEGYAINEGFQRVDFGGLNLTDYLESTLSKNGINLPKTLKSREILNDIKEKCCYIALDHGTELTSPTKPVENFQLPDGSTITLKSERFEIPEVLFQPNLLGLKSDVVGVDQLALNSIMKCNLDIRRDLYANVVLSGGTTNCPGFVERLEKELMAKSPSQMNIGIIAKPERQHLVWSGASILGDLSIFENMWISKQTYEEAGSSIVYTKCF